MEYFYWLRVKNSNHLHTELSLGYPKDTMFYFESKASFIDISSIISFKLLLVAWLQEYCTFSDSSVVSLKSWPWPKYIHWGTIFQKKLYSTIKLSFFFKYALYLRNRKHVPCFYLVIQTRVEVWENEKCCGNTSRRRVFPQLFRVLPNFHECLYNSIETRSTCFLFLLENNATRKRKTTC